MCHIIKTSDLMLQSVRSKVTTIRSTPGQSVVGQTSCPHHLRAGIIILRILLQNLRIHDHRTHQAFRNAVSNLHIPTTGKVTLHRMHQDIRTSTCCLIIRKRHCKFRIHNCKSRTSVITTITSLNPSIFIGNHRRITHLTTGCRKRQHHPDWKTALCLSLPVIKLPDIPFIRNSVPNGFCRVNRTSATNSKNEVHSFLLRKLNPLIYQ